MYTDVITLFNRKEGDEGDTWYPSVLRNVQLNMDRAAIVAEYGATATDNAVLNDNVVDLNKVHGSADPIHQKQDEDFDIAHFTQGSLQYFCHDRIPP
jgi:hypothetical protein